MGNRFPYVSPHAAAGLSSPSMGSPSYSSALNHVYPSPSWFQFPFLDATKTGFITPFVMGVRPSQISPNFATTPIEQFQLEMAGLNSSPSFFHPSPLESPDTGATIAPLGTKVPPTSAAPLKLTLNNGVACSSQGFRLSPPNTQSGITPSPLLSMRKLVVPPATTSVTNIANSLASGASTKHHHHHNNENGDGKNDGSLKRSSTDAHYRTGNGSSMVHRQSTKEANKKPHIKKPLNAFMLYMKEMRPKVMQEAGLKERQSAEINRILGRRWHSLTRDEQQKYYDMARKVRQEHLQKYPGWSARDNYAIHKKKKRKRDKAQDGLDNLEAKKCRARFGLDQQSKWCKHCRRKKKCLWFKDGDNENGDASEASPPAQVTSTSQFSSSAVVDETDGATTTKNESVRQPTTAAEQNGNNNNVSSPHSLVTSTTIGRRLSVSEGDDDCGGDSTSFAESGSEFGDSGGDDEENPNLSASKRLKLISNVKESTTAAAPNDEKNDTQLSLSSPSSVQQKTLKT